MNELKIVKTSLKCALFSSTFLILLLAFEKGFEVLPFWFIAFIITFIISFMMIVVTILPIYQIVASKSKEDFFKRYFPYYALLFFTSCVFLWSKSNFGKQISEIYLTAFLTAMLSWVWLFENETLKETI